MKTIKYLLLFVLILGPLAMYAQRTPIQFWRPNNYQGVNVFEDPKVDSVEFDGVAVRVGGDFAIQFQSLNQENADNGLVELGSNFNLPTANLNLDVQLYDGLRMHLRTYLSSRNHAEAWVKGGHMAIDKLDFISEGFAEEIMKVLRFRIGLDEINYGDAHFRRSDNARVIFNPFVGNYLMDAFTTEAFGEVTVLTPGGFIGMLGVSNGKLNQSVAVNPDTDNGTSFYGKLGYDQRFQDDFRFRITGSWYINNGTSTGFYLYGGDRAGSRYYSVMHTINPDDRDSNFAGRINPRFAKLTSFQINPFLEIGGLEFFGVFEVASDGDDATGGSYTQLAGDLIYRFGSWEQFYLGLRYNSVSGEPSEGATTQNINRFNLGGGWFMTRNVLAKIEYVSQNYTDGFDGQIFEDASFNGIMLEAAISF
ncbi:MAG: hypothetical protein ACNS62_20305 [Candidatus Cyclobacteriaceae bacterium M3_2C_046]